MRPFRFYVSRIVVFVFVFLLGIDAHATDNLPAQTIVVFNTAVADSEALAKFYAEKRGSADDHLVGLDCPPQEEISREDYDATIAEPLRKIFEERQWWHVHEAPKGEKRVQTLGIHFVALISGMPRKIRPVATPYPGDTPGGGPLQSRNEASVDSELSVLGLFTRQISGVVPNPYFQGFRPVAEVTAAPLLLVTRLDAPASAT